MATRADIRSYARIRADQDSSTFPTDTQYNTMLDFAGRRVWYDLVKAGWPVYFSSVTKTATGSNPIALAASGTVGFVTGVYRLDGTTPVPLARLNEGDRFSMMGQSGQASHYSLAIDPALGPVLELFPIPSSGSYVVQYITEWPGFANDATVWVGPGRTDELVGLAAAAMGCRKEGNDQGAAQLDKEYAEVLQSVQDMASWFDMRNPPVIRDVQGGLGKPSMPFDFEL